MAYNSILNPPGTVPQSSTPGVKYRSILPPQTQPAVASSFANEKTQLKTQLQPSGSQTYLDSISSNKELSNALKTGGISHDQFISQFAKINNTPTKMNKYSVGNILGAAGGAADKVVVKPIVNTAKLPINLASLGTAEVTGNDKAITKSTKALTSNSLNSLIGPLAQTAVIGGTDLAANKVLNNKQTSPEVKQAQLKEAVNPSYNQAGFDLADSSAKTKLKEAALVGGDIATPILTKGGIKAVSDSKALTAGAQTTARNVATKNVLDSLKKPNETPLPSPAESPKLDVTPGETQIEPKGQGALPETKPVSGTPAKMPKLAPNEEGSVAPGQVATDVKNLIAKSKQNKTIGSNLSDKLFNLKQNTTADVNIATKILKDTKNATPKDWEAAYHYREDPTSPVTTFQKSLHDNVIKPLYDSVAKEGQDPNYQHRINIDKRGFVQSLLKGDVRGMGNNLLRKTTDADKSRVMKAVVDDQGNRTVVAIKTPKDELGLATGSRRVTGFNDKQASDLGALKIKTNEDLLDKEVKPYKTQLAKLQQQAKSLNKIKVKEGVPIGRINQLTRKVEDLRNMNLFMDLPKSAAKSLDRAHNELKILTGVKQFKNQSNLAAHVEKINSKIEAISKQIDDTTAKYNPEELNSKQFVDKNGKKYTITDATTKEIEQHTNIKYSHHALLNAVTHFVQTRSAQRAEEFINTWKTSPEFKQIARSVNDSNIPDHYIGTQAAQFRGFVFEPKVAHYLDDFAGRYAKDPLQAITGLNKFLTTTIFVNPLVHLPNEFISALVNRGVSGFVNPVGLVRGGKTAGRAIVSVIKNDTLQQDLQRSGMPTMSRGNEEFNYTMNKMIAKQLRDPNIESRLIKAGISSPKRLAQLWMHEVHKMTWISQDIFNTQAVLENEAKGMSREAAIKRAFTTGKGNIPDYRAPTTLLGSRQAKNVIFNPNISVFSSYHYGIIKSYMNIAKAAVARDSTIKDRANALDKLAMMGIVAYVLYPQADKLAQKITGNSNAQVRRSGPLTIPFAAYEATKGQKSPGQVATDVITPPPGTKTAAELISNKDAFGNQIYKPSEAKSNPKQLSKDVGRFGLTAISPAGIVQRGVKKPAKTIASILGVSEPQSAIQTKVYNLLGQQLGSSGMSVDTQRTNAQKNAARDQISKGQGNSLAKGLVSSGVLTEKGLKDFETKAKWTPVQRAFDSLSPENKLQVLNSSKSGETNQLIVDRQALLVSLSNTAQSKTAKDSTKQAASQLISKLGGNQGDLFAQFKAQARINARLNRTSSRHR